MRQGSALRIVSWNCRGGLQQKCAPLRTLAPDIAVIQECLEPARWQSNLPGAQVLWHGVAGKRGLAVIAFGAWRIAWGAEPTFAVQLFLPVAVRGPAAFNLLGVWTKAAQPEARAYIGQLYGALAHYAPFLQQAPVVVAGDINANAIWDTGKPWQYHSVVRSLHTLGMASAYHALTGEPYGREQQDTYRHCTGARFHLDHCFAPHAWLTPQSRVQVGADDWLTLSDHKPLIVDLAPGAIELPAASDNPHAHTRS